MFAKNLKLNNGVEMPAVGLGTYPMNGMGLAFLVRKAVKLGYRSFDTASAYGNERWLGIGIKLCGKSRTDLFSPVRQRCAPDPKDPRLRAAYWIAWPM